MIGSRQVVRQERSVVLFLGACFAVFGVVIGGHGVLFARVMEALELSALALGTLLLLPPLAAALLMPLIGRWADRAGKKLFLISGLLLLALAHVALGFAASWWVLAPAMVLVGLGDGCLETGMNGAAVDWEQSRGRPLLNAMHAAFSAGAIVGSFGSGWLLEGGLGYPVIFTLLAVLVGCLLLPALSTTLPITVVDETDPVASSLPTALRLIRGQPVLLLLSVVALLAVLAESIAFSWSVIYLQSLGIDLARAAQILALFNGAMLVGRLVNTRIVMQIGPRSSLVISGALLVVAGMLVAAPLSPLLAALGFILAGLGVAGVFPTALSVAAGANSHNTGLITGSIMSVAYLGFVIAPPLIGSIADASSLRVAMLALPLSGLVLWLVARSLPRSATP